MARSKIIAVVGVDGSGKTSQARRLAARLAASGVPARYFENAGGRPTIARFAQRFGRPDGIALLGRGGYLTFEATVRFLALTRALLWSRVTGEVAVMDRFAYCQYAMMRARGHRGERAVRTLYAVFGRPDLTCFFDVSPAQAQQRVEQRGRDSEELDYLAALDAAYRSLPEYREWTIVDAAGSEDEVETELGRIVAARLGLPAEDVGCPS
ncbi:MAG: deoxynucleoside kinase [Hamadaea sp.]|nr:deoxynucleoside kinase [Hamadaea sp.]